MTDIAIFAAGCFWGIEEKFLSTKGVKETEVGYIGGKTDNPTYKDVSVRVTHIMRRQSEFIMIVMKSPMTNF